MPTGILLYNAPQEIFDVYAQWGVEIWTYLEGSETLTWGEVLIEAYRHCDCLGAAWGSEQDIRGWLYMAEEAKGHCRNFWTGTSPSAFCGPGREGIYKSILPPSDPEYRTIYQPPIQYSVTPIYNHQLLAWFGHSPCLPPLDPSDVAFTPSQCTLL